MSDTSAVCWWRWDLGRDSAKSFYFPFPSHSCQFFLCLFFSITNSARLPLGAHISYFGGSQAQLILIYSGTSSLAAAGQMRAGVMWVC